MSLDSEVLRYDYNLFAFPENYFEIKSAEELGISEEARQILIKERKEFAEKRRKIEEEGPAPKKNKRFEEFVNLLKNGKPGEAGK